MIETAEHNNRFYGEELKTENEQLKEWLVIANKENERLNNIINSMNDYLIMNIANGELDFMYRQGFRESYERLQELKGSGKNE